MPRLRRRQPIFDYQLYGQTFGPLVRECRRALNWPLRVLATATGIHRSSLCGLEQGHRGLPNYQFDRLIEVLAQASLENAVGYTRQDLLRSAGILASPISAQPPPPTPNTVVPAAPSPSNAEQTAAQSRWQQSLAAAQQLHQLAWEASIRGEWDDWARYTVRAGINAIDLAEMQDAKECLQRVLTRRQADQGLRISDSILIDARVWLGAVHLECGADREARQILEAVTRYPNEPCPGSLSDGGKHFLGRAYCRLGATERDDAQVARGLELLRQSQASSQQCGDTDTQGSALLNQVTAFATLEACVRPSRMVLDKAAELLGCRGTAAAHVGRVAAELFLLDGQDRRARQYMEKAEHTYLREGFAPAGLAAIYRAHADLSIGSPAAAQKALEYALCATVLWPYRESLTVLETTVQNLVWSVNGAPMARKTIREAEERLRRMDDAPFHCLKSLTVLMGSAAASYIERGLTKAARTVAQKLQ